jgi:hypothetical protein
MRRLGSICAIVLTLVLVEVGVLAPAALAAEKTRYSGHLAQHPSAPVQFAVSADQDRILNFRAGHVPLSCDDGVVRFAEGLGGRGFNLGKSHGKFTRHSFGEDANGTAVVLEVNARLLPDGRARGTLLYITDPQDDPAGGSHFADCSTYGYIHWRAEP